MRLIALASVFCIAAACSRSAPVAESIVSPSAPRVFAERQVRYMSPLDLLELLSRALPVKAELLGGECTSLNDSNRGLLGDNVPSTGSPIFDQPTSTFVRWYSGCVNNRLQWMGELGMPDSRPEMFLGPSLALRYAENPALLQEPFANLSRDERKTMVLEHIDQLIGPDEIIADFGYFASSAALADHVLGLLGDNMTVSDAAKRSLFLLALRDEFLSY